MTAAAAVVLAQGAPSIRDYVQANLRDVRFIARKQSANQAELAKINRDFGHAYRVDFTEFMYKEPMMLRAESTVEEQKVLYVLNGPTRMYRIPSAGISTRENLAKAPGKRQTPLDFGLLTPGLFDGFFVAQFVRRDTRLGALVFDIRHDPKLNDDTRHRVWVDPDKKFTIRREWYSQIDNNRLMAIFSYEDPKQVNGVWIPTKIVVRNAENKLAGSSAYTEIRVNTGLADSLFSVR